MSIASLSIASLAAPISRAEKSALILLTLSQIVLFLVPITLLGQAIGWPASLRLPAAEALPLIARNAMALQVGYWGYLLTAVAMVPFVIALRRHALAFASPRHPGRPDAGPVLLQEPCHHRRSHGDRGCGRGHLVGG